MIKKLKLLKHYKGKSNRSVYECNCGMTVEAWTLAEAYKKHKHSKSASK